MEATGNAAAVPALKQQGIHERLTAAALSTYPACIQRLSLQDSSSLHIPGL